MKKTITPSLLNFHLIIKPTHTFLLTIVYDVRTSYTGIHNWSRVEWISMSYKVFQFFPISFGCLFFVLCPFQSHCHFPLLFSALWRKWREKNMYGKHVCEGRPNTLAYCRSPQCWPNATLKSIFSCLYVRKPEIL